MTVSGEAIRNENSVSFNNVKTIHSARNENPPKPSTFYAYIENLPENGDNKDTGNEELSWIIDNFKDASVIKKLLPLTFSVSEVTDKPVYITDIQSQGSVTIVHGAPEAESSQNLTLVFMKKRMPSSESDETWTLRKIDLYPSDLKFEDLDTAKAEIFFTEVDSKSQYPFSDSGHYKKRTKLSDVSAILLSVSASVFSVALLIATPIMTCYIPYVLYNSAKYKFELF